MDAQAGMLAQPLERPMGLGEEWEVSDAWFEERGDAPDGLHVRVARKRGQAVECPVCHRRCGTHDTCERTWRHPGIWQYETDTRIWRLLGRTVSEASQGGTEATGRGPPRPRATWPKHISSARP